MTIMLISKEWLSEFVVFPKKLSDTELAGRLSLCTVEVEGIKKGTTGEWDNIVIGEIVELKRHPNADRLRIVMTRVSKTGDPICIVCGGSNVAVGMKVAVALPKSRVRLARASAADTLLNIIIMLDKHIVVQLQIFQNNAGSARHRGQGVVRDGDWHL